MVASIFLLIIHKRSHMQSQTKLLHVEVLSQNQTRSSNPESSSGISSFQTMVEPGVARNLKTACCVQLCAQCYTQLNVKAIVRLCALFEAETNCIKQPKDKYEVDVMDLCNRALGPHS